MCISQLLMTIGFSFNTPVEVHRWSGAVRYPTMAATTRSLVTVLAAVRA